VFFGWFFVVNLWWFDGGFVVFRRSLLGAENFPLFEYLFFGDGGSGASSNKMRGSFTTFRMTTFQTTLDGLGLSALVGGGEFAEAGNGGGYDIEGFVDLFCGGEAGEGEADAGSGAGGGKAHCGEDV